MSDDGQNTNLNDPAFRFFGETFLESCNLRPPVGSYVVIGLYYVSNKVTVKEEYYTYDTANIIADFGGYLGLLLGYSILGFYDNSIGVLSRLRANWKKYASKDDSTE